MSAVMTNNAESRLLNGISTGATTITVSAGEGSLFPTLAPNEWFPLTLVRSDGSNYEIVRVVARTGDDMTIERAQENTPTAVAFTAGDIVSSRLTWETLMDLVSSISNLAADSVTGGSDKYVVSIPAITSYEDNQTVSFIPHAASAGASTLRINSLPEINIRKRTGTGGATVTDIVSGDIYVGQIANLHYESGLGVFILDNPVPAGVADGTVSVKGIVQLAATPSSYNPTSGNNSRPVTQLTASQIVEEAIDASDLTQKLPFMWRNQGNEAGGAFTISNGNNVQVVAGNENQYTDFTVAAGGLMTTGNGFGCRVIRCTGTFTCDGDINLPRANSRWPERVVGPTGSSKVVGGDQNSPFVQQQMWTNSNPINNPDHTVPFDRFLTRRQFEGAVHAGFPFRVFTGGHGDGNNTFGLPANAGGGMVIIADEINLNAGGSMLNGHVLDGAFEGPSAGAMVMLVANVINIDPSFTFELGLVGVPNNSGYYVAQRSTDTEDLMGASNGHLFTIGLTSGIVTRVF